MWLVSPPRAAGKNELTNPANSTPWIYWKLTVPAEIKATFYGSEHMRCRRYVHQEDAPKSNPSGAGTTAFIVRLRESFWGAFRNAVNWGVLEGDKFTWNSRKGPRSHPVHPVIEGVGESHDIHPLLRLPPPSRLEAVPGLLTSSLLLSPPHLSAGPFFRQVGRREGGYSKPGVSPRKGVGLGTDKASGVERDKALAPSFLTGEVPTSLAGSPDRGPDSAVSPVTTVPSWGNPSFFPPLFPSFSLNTSVYSSPKQGTFLYNYDDQSENRHNPMSNL